jgi:EAL domain-containing protein (putative c-di-GMP-specific phosphodiesterase class I)
MRTEVISEPRAVAWLEFYPPSGSAVKRYPLEGGPFCLGRSETTDLPVNSTRVSREHALIERRGGGWRIRDLKSTNGTFVNGERIEESPLADGDTVKVADVEFTFHALNEEPTLSFTQVMESDEPAAPKHDALGDWVRTLRRMRESLLRGGRTNRYEPVYRLESRALFGYEAVSASDSADEQSSRERQIFATECLLSERLRQLQRLTAVEEVAAMGGDVRLLLNVASAEVGARPLIDALEALHTRAGRQRLIVEIPVNAVCDTPAFRDFLAVLREREVGVLYDNFAGRSTHASLQRELAPDYVKLAGSLTRGVEQSSDRQRQIQAIVRACQDVDCEVMVQGVAQAAAEVCGNLGCTFAQGDLFQSTTNHDPGHKPASNKVTNNKAAPRAAQHGAV